MALGRRELLLGMAGAALFSGRAAAQAEAPANWERYYDGYAQDGTVTFPRTRLSTLDPQWRRQLVKYKHKEPPGSIVVDTRNNFLYVTFENNTALRYGVGVGREGFQWSGRAQVGRKARWPDWVPPPEMLQRRPDLPRHMEGGADNPLGARALYLYRDGRDLLYRIHGTNEPWSIGGDNSSGCIRMVNEDVIDLYRRIPVGTRVLVLEHLDKSLPS
ncbi:MAG: L,D-transpeptidase [Proteobacteria bacterium]|nr:L,D-transpeptidase [Pseudomonadota bacterium]